MLKKIKNKKAISLMVSYVILIAIIASISVGVFAWLKIVANVSPVIDCKSGTSVIIEDYQCSTGEELDPAGIEIILKNNGRFNVDGIIFAVGDSSARAPITYLIPQASGSRIPGHYFFLQPLKPGESKTIGFSNEKETGVVTFIDGKIKVAQIQPFILTPEGKVVCQEAVIKQDITDCKIIP